MTKVRFVGLDVHADSIAIAVAEQGRGDPAVLGTIPNHSAQAIKTLRRLGPRVKCCYEAGPTGLVLQRDLAAAGIDCVVVAPSLVPGKAGERVKTDRRDAVKLARFLRSGDLTPIHVLDSATEAMRDLERAREDAIRMERTARHQLQKFLLRHGHRFPGKRAWTKEHFRWLHGQRFEHEAQQRVLEDYLSTVLSATDRVARLTKSIAELVQSWELWPVAKALQAMRGISTVGAVTLIAEIGDFKRFARATDFMSYTGLVPSESSSGTRRSQGSITKCGNGHVRRVLVEAAWAYRFRPGRHEALRKRSEGVSEHVQAIAWKAQERLCARYRRLMARGKEKNKIVVAIARELAAFVWAISREEQLKLHAAAA